MLFCKFVFHNINNYLKWHEEWSMFTSQSFIYSTLQFTLHILLSSANKKNQSKNQSNVFALPKTGNATQTLRCSLDCCEIFMLFRLMHFCAIKYTQSIKLTRILHICV